jgi:hypothetical protein
MNGLRNENGVQRLPRENCNIYQFDTIRNQKKNTRWLAAGPKIPQLKIVT